MIGGSYNYIYSQLASELGIPTGMYNEISSVNTNHVYKLAQKRNPMNDIVYILHSLEWYESGDIGEDKYKQDVKAFKNKWFKRTKNDRMSECKELVKSFAEELCDEYFGKE